MNRLSRRQLLAGGAVAAAATLTAGTVAVQAIAGGANPQALLVDFIRKERLANGRQTVVGNPGLQLQAELQARRMALQGALEHSPPGEQGWWAARIGNGVAPGWYGEMAAVTGDLTEPGMLEVHRGWIRSDGHRPIMFDPRARLIGVGVCEWGNRAWVIAALGG